MHPRQALWLVDPSLALRVHADGVEAEALDAFGTALLDHPAFAVWRRMTERGRGAGAIAALRAFLAVFAEGGGDAADDAVLAARSDSKRIVSPHRSRLARVGRRSVCFSSRHARCSATTPAPWQHVARFEDRRSLRPGPRRAGARVGRGARERILDEVRDFRPAAMRSRRRLAQLATSAWFRSP